MSEAPLVSMLATAAEAIRVNVVEPTSDDNGDDTAENGEDYPAAGGGQNPSRAVIGEEREARQRGDAIFAGGLSVIADEPGPSVVDLSVEATGEVAESNEVYEHEEEVVDVDVQGGDDDESEEAFEWVDFEPKPKRYRYRRQRYSLARSDSRLEPGVLRGPRPLSLLTSIADNILAEGKIFSDRHEAELAIAEYCEAKGARPTTSSAKRVKRRYRKDYSRLTVGCAKLDCMFEARLNHNIGKKWCVSRFRPHTCDPAVEQDQKPRHSRTAYKARHLLPIVNKVYCKEKKLSTKVLAEVLKDYLHFPPTPTFMVRFKRQLKNSQLLRGGEEQST